MPAAKASKMEGRGLLHWGLVDWGRLGSLDVGSSLPGCLLLYQDGGGLGDVAPMLATLAGYDDLGRDSALL